MNKKRAHPLKHIDLLTNLKLENDHTSVYIGNVFNELIGQLDKNKKCKQIVGCMAWLTHPILLQRLAKKDSISILIQKENSFKMRKWPIHLYKRLKSKDGSSNAIRTLGYCNRKSQPLFHHKFLVFCDEEGIAYAVWISSMNGTNNGERSRDSGMFINDPTIALLYYQEWEQLFQNSEQLIN